MKHSLMISSIAFILFANILIAMMFYHSTFNIYLLSFLYILFLLIVFSCLKILNAIYKRINDVIKIVAKVDEIKSFLNSIQYDTALKEITDSILSGPYENNTKYKCIELLYNNDPIYLYETISKYEFFTSDDILSHWRVINTFDRHLAILNEKSFKRL